MGATPNGIYGLKLFPGLFDAVSPHLRLTEVLPSLSFVRLDDLLRDLLTVRGEWHPAVWEKVQDAVTGSEHHATRALADALRSKAVLTALQRQLQLLLR